MKKYEELFELIHSLSKSEKRHFTIYCKQNLGETNYLKLFREIDKQEVYDEAKIKKKFQKEKFVVQLHVTKNYLKALILKSLRSYHSKKTKKTQIIDVIRNVEVLVAKELYQIALAEIDKAEKIIDNFEMDTLGIEVLQWKRKIVQATTPFDTVKIGEIIDLEERVTQRLFNTFQHKKHNVAIYNLFLKSFNQPRQEGDELNVIEYFENQEEALKSATENNSLEGRVYYSHSLYYTCIQQNDHQKAEQVLDDLITHLERFPDRLEEEPGLYISSVNNFIGYLVFLKKYQKALKLVNKAKVKYDQWGFISGNKVLIKQVLRTYNIELEIYRDLKSYETYPEAIQKIEEFIVRYESKAPHEYLILFWFQFASISFMQKNYAVSLRWVNKLLNYPAKTVRLDLQVYARLLNLMIHVELKNVFVLGYYIDSTRRFLKKNKTYDRWKEVLLKSFSKIRRTPDYELEAVFKKLNDQFFPENDEPLVTVSVLDYIDFRKWIKDHLKQ